MFDCPDAIQTSPIATLLCTTTEFFPLIVISKGPPAVSSGNLTIQ